MINHVINHVINHGIYSPRYVQNLDSCLRTSSPALPSNRMECVTIDVITRHIHRTKAHIIRGVTSMVLPVVWSGGQYLHPAVSSILSC